MKLRLSQYLGYALGDAANNLTFSMASAFLLIYYTDVAGIPAAPPAPCSSSCGSGAASPTSSPAAFVDKVDTRWGKFRPYLLSARCPCSCSSSPCSASPSGLERGRQGCLGLRLLRAVLPGLQLRQHPVRIPVGGDDPGPRRASQAVDVTILAGSVTILVIAAVVSPQISGGGDLQRSLTITTIVFAVVGYLLYL